MSNYLLFAVPTWGSAIAELVFQHTNLPYSVEYLKATQVRSADYRTINPLAQIPSLRIPDGRIVTGSLPVCTYINDMGQAGLIPAKESPEYPTYLRWSFFINDAIYTHASYFDHPDWYLKHPVAQKELKEKTLERAIERWALLEKECAEPWFLGSHRSLIDCYLAVMTYWEPGRDWFRERCPRLMRVVERIQGTDEFAKVYERNNPETRP